jgi:hypothetical protein
MDSAPSAPGPRSPVVSLPLGGPFSFTSTYPAQWDIGPTNAPYDTPSESHGEEIAKYKI